MKVLMLSIDRNILKEGTPVFERMIQYGKMVKELHIIVIGGKNDVKKIIGNVYIYPIFLSLRPLYFFKAFALAKEIIGAHSKNFIITSQESFTNVMALILKWKYKIPVEMQVHTDVFSSYFIRESFLNRIRSYISRISLGFVDGIRVVSPRIKKSIIAINSAWESKVSIIPIRIDIKNIRLKTHPFDLHKKYSQFDTVILVASRISKEKNIDLAIDCMSDIVKSYPKTGLVIVGDGPEKNHIMRRIRARNMTKNIVIEGWQENIIPYFKSADIFLLTSNYEGYALVLIEALASGTPVVSTDVGLIGDIITDDMAAVCPVGNRKCLTQALKEHIDNHLIGKINVFNSVSLIDSIAEYKESDYILDIKNNWERILK